MAQGIVPPKRRIRMFIWALLLCVLPFAATFVHTQPSFAQSAGKPEPQLILTRSWNSSNVEDVAIILNYDKGNVIVGEYEIESNVTLINRTGTWVFVEQDFTATSTSYYPVSGNYVFLLGPFAEKRLGTVRFGPGSFLQLNATTSIGVSAARVLHFDQKAVILYFTLLIDLMTRGLFNTELDPLIFDQASSLLLNIVQASRGVGIAVRDPLLFQIEKYCSGSMGAMMLNVIDKDWIKSVKSALEFFKCSEQIQDVVKKFLERHYGTQIAKNYITFLKKFAELVDLVPRLESITRLGDATTTAPGESWVRVEVRKEEVVRKADGGLATALVLDVSGSMDWQSSLDSTKKKIDIAREAANLFVDAAQPQESCSVSVFSATASTDSQLAMAACGDIAGRVKPTLAGVPASGGTNIGAGLDAAFQELLKLKGRPAPTIAVLLSDGANTVGKWRPSACKFARPDIAMCSSPGKGWPVYTVGLYTDRAVLQQVVRGGTLGSQAMSSQTQEEDMRTTLTQIADMTGGRFYPPSTANLGSIFAQIRSHASGGSTLLSQDSFLPRNGSLNYSIGVTPGAEYLTVIPTWYGSSIETVLISPSRRTIRANDLMPPSGRYVQGGTYEIVQVNRPMGGKWQVRLKWADPPDQADGERVNLIISEKTDISLNLLGFKGEYEIGEPVKITLDVAEYTGGKRMPFADARVRVQVQKPGGPKMAQMIRTRPIDLRSAKRAVQGATRNIRLSDDGAHDDYRAGDGIFGGTFTETDENGAYLVTATVTGHKRNGQRVQRRLIASFQVGPIAQNPVTTAQVLEVRDLLEDRTDPAEAIKALQSDPLAAIKGSQSDPLDAINKLRQGVQ